MCYYYVLVPVFLSLSNLHFIVYNLYKDLISLLHYSLKLNNVLEIDNTFGNI